MEPLFFLSCDLSRVKVADRLAGLSETIEEDIYCRGKNKLDDQMIIIELGYRKISWFVIVSQINFLLRHWQITIFYSTSSNEQQFRSPVRYDFVFLPRSWKISCRGYTWFDMWLLIFCRVIHLVLVWRHPISWFKSSEMSNFCLIKKESGFEDLSVVRLFPELPLSVPPSPPPQERVVVCTQATYPYYWVILKWPWT